MKDEHLTELSVVLVLTNADLTVVVMNLLQDHTSHWR